MKERALPSLPERDWSLRGQGGLSLKPYSSEFESEAIQGWISIICRKLVFLKV